MPNFSLIGFIHCHTRTAKNGNFTKRKRFGTVWGLLYSPLFPGYGKIWHGWTRGVLYHATLRLDRCILGQKMHKKRILITFCNCTSVLTHLTDQCQIWLARTDLCTKFHLDCFLGVALIRRNPQIWPYFQLQHSLMVPASSIEMKLNAGVQLQTFP